MGNGLWHYHHKHSPFPNHHGLFIITIRLPKGARLLNADPPPRKSSTRTGRLSLTWRTITEPVSPELEEVNWQFQAHLDYALDPA